MRRSHLIALGLAFLIPITSTQAQRSCRTGIPCGNTCIAANRTCRVGTSPSAPGPTVRPSPTSSAPPPATDRQVELSGTSSPESPSGTTGLTVPGVPGYIALDSTELVEVQAARLRALTRLQSRSVRQAGGALGISSSSTQAVGDTIGGAVTASSATSTRTWVASNRGKVYYRAGCRAASSLNSGNLVFFDSEEAAQAAGYRRSTSAGC